MYSHFRGTVEELGADRAVIDANGVGYELFCSKNTRKPKLATPLPKNSLTIKAI